MKDLPGRLLVLRKEKGLSQEVVAKAVGITCRTYQRYESGEREPVASVLVSMAELYNVSVDDLLGRKVGRPSQP